MGRRKMPSKANWTRISTSGCAHTAAGPPGTCAWFPSLYGCPSGASRLGKAPAARSGPTAALVPAVMREPGEMGSVPVVEDAPPKESAPPVGRQAVRVQGVLSECFRNPALLWEELFPLQDMRRCSSSARAGCRERSGPSETQIRHPHAPRHGGWLYRERRGDLAEHWTRTGSPSPSLSARRIALVPGPYPRRRKVHISVGGQVVVRRARSRVALPGSSDFSSA